LNGLIDELHHNMSDDFNTARALAVLFEMSSRINDLKTGNLPWSDVDVAVFENFKQTYIGFMEDVLGIREEAEHDHEMLNGIIQVLIELRKKAREDKNFPLSDRIRDDLKKLGVQLKDGKDGEITFALE
jgi:cysteinyl-tRNA synthetase